MFINTVFLKFFYSALLTGLPSISYNPFNQNTLHAPFIVNEGSTYINYKLNKEQFNQINNYLETKTNNLKLQKISILKENEIKESIGNSDDYYLSINIYNCTSPIFSFLSNDPATRCEINTYIKTKNEEDIGTLIMDYTSNLLSVDPDNIFKKSCKTKFLKSKNTLSCAAYSDNIFFELEYDFNNILKTQEIKPKLVKYSDKIFYNNGLYDKLYYDSSLIHNHLQIPYYFNIQFKFMGIEFDTPHSIFFFKDKINFVGGMWENLKKL